MRINNLRIFYQQVLLTVQVLLRGILMPSNKQKN